MKRTFLAVTLLLAVTACSHTDTATTGTPTSLIPFAGTNTTCAVLNIQDGVTIVPDDVTKLGTICQPDGHAAGITTTKCKTGPDLAWASDYAWWRTGQPAHLGKPPTNTGCL